MYLSVQIENFRLCAALRKAGRELQGPAILVEDDATTIELNQAALNQQILPGMTAVRALARCHDLVVVNRDTQAEQSGQRALWHSAWQITSQIELGEGTELGCALLEIVRPNLDQLIPQVDQLLQRLRRSGLPARAGLAETPDWAIFAGRAVERYGFKILPTVSRAKEMLQHLPLPLLECLSPEVCKVIEGWGIRSLGALADLPRQSLGERLGPIGLRAWDILNGAYKRVLHFGELKTDYSETYDLEHPIYDLEGLCFLVRQAAERLESQLKENGQMARALSIEVWQEAKGGDCRKTIQLPEATRRAELIERLLRNHLEQIRLRGAVIKLRICADPVDPLSRQAGLFERSVRNPWRLQETLDQLAGLVGIEAFGTPSVVSTHRPDTYKLEPLDLDISDLTSDPPDRIRQGPPLMGPPLRRFRPAIPASIVLKGQNPIHVSSEILDGVVRHYHGPYCLSGDWADKDAWALREWDIEVESQGVYCLRYSAGKWHLTGAYD